MFALLCWAFVGLGIYLAVRGAWWWVFVPPGGFIVLIILFAFLSEALYEERWPHFLMEWEKREGKDTRHASRSQLARMRMEYKDTVRTEYKQWRRDRKETREYLHEWMERHHPTPPVYPEPVIRPLSYPTQPQREEVELLFAGEHFAFGRGPWREFYGVWDSQAGGALLEKFPTYFEAWARFDDMERRAKRRQGSPGGKACVH
jgi:hypothetical protein